MSVEDRLAELENQLATLKEVILTCAEKLDPIYAQQKLRDRVQECIERQPIFPFHTRELPFNNYRHFSGNMK